MKKNIYSTLLLILFSMCAFAQLPSYVPTNGLYAWYSFNGNTDDQSGNGHHGTVTGAVPGADRYGNPLYAYSFDGDGDFIELAGTDTFSGATGFTLAAWVYFPNGSSGAAITKHQNGSPNGFTLGTGSNRAVMAINNGGPHVIFSPLAYNDSNWHFFTGTYDGDEMRLYVDTVLISTMTAVSPPNFTQFSIQIGMESTMSPFSGMIDEAGIWTRALSDAEIDSLYRPASIGIESISKPLARIYPNPVSDFVSIDAAFTANHNLEIKILNALNQVVFSGVMKKAQEKIDVSTFSPGHYFIRIEDKHGAVQFEKLVIR